jgi:hypothetical protein
MNIKALDEQGKLVIETHQWGDKAPIPSGFFRLPEAAHVSAVIPATAARSPNSTAWAFSASSDQSRCW